MSLPPYVHAPGAELADGALLDLDDATLHHLRRVLRLRDGAGLVVADGVALQAAATLDGGRVRVVATPVERERRLPAITVWQAVGKGSRTEDAVRMCTEAGASAVRLVVAERTVRRLDAGGGEKLRRRCADVAASAAAQCRRPSLVAVTGPDAVAGAMAGHALGHAADGSVLLVLDHRGAELSSDRALRRRMAAAGARAGERVTVAVGPEGGWTEAELDRFAAAGAATIGLSTHVLRMEHAGFAAVVALRSLTD